jgi:hypothetical protein
MTNDPRKGGYFMRGLKILAWIGALASTAVAVFASEKAVSAIGNAINITRRNDFEETEFGEGALKHDADEK